MSADTLAERYELCQTRGVTLDGQPANIAGARNRFATVRMLTGLRYGHEWAWETVARVVASGGAFQS